MTWPKALFYQIDIFFEIYAADDTNVVIVQAHKEKMVYRQLDKNHKGDSFKAKSNLSDW